MNTTNLILTGILAVLVVTGCVAPQQQVPPARVMQRLPEEKGFTHDKDAPGVVSAVETWDYPGIYYSTSSGANTPEKVVVNVSAKVTANPDGSIHWWSFRVHRISPLSNPNQYLAFDVVEENPGASANRPVIVIEGKYRLVPKITSIYQILFEQEPQK